MVFCAELSLTTGLNCSKLNFRAPLWLLEWGLVFCLTESSSALAVTTWVHSGLARLSSVVDTKMHKRWPSVESSGADSAAGSCHLLQSNWNLLFNHTKPLAPDFFCHGWERLGVVVFLFLLRWMNSYCLVFMDDGAEAQILNYLKASLCKQEEKK